LALRVCAPYFDNLDDLGVLAHGLVRNEWFGGRITAPGHDDRLDTGAVESGGGFFAVKANERVVKRGEVGGTREIRLGDVICVEDKVVWQLVLCGGDYNYLKRGCE